MHTAGTAACAPRAGTGGAGAMIGSLPRRWQRVATAMALLARWRYLVLPLGGVALGWSARHYYVADFLLFARAGSRLLHGDLAAVYAAPRVQAGPFELLFFTPFGALDGDEPALGHALLAAGGTALATAGAMAAARWFRRCHGGLRDSALAELAVGGLALAWGACQAPVQTGHPAQVAVPLLWVAAAVAARRHRALTAGLLLGLAAGWETWGVLAAPVALLAPGRRAVVTAAATQALVTAALYAPFVASGRFAMGGYSWPVSRASLVWHLVPDPEAGFPWNWRLAQGALAGLACAAVALATRGAWDGVWLAPLAAVAVRLVLDPVLYEYYWVPVLVLALLALATLDTRRPVDAATIAALAWWSALDSARNWPGTLAGTVPALLLLTFRARLGCRA